ncbi:hypothetical protein ACUNV4_13610 [Granulosicoccus sp. 3-233]|uniref:hypothetical protein n=1 Tax=Granulosicoccus sp. 3-233 TaxID=3417969 RepID=UPI003D324D8C
MNQILPLLNLYSEFIACLVAAGVLSLFSGWMMHRSRASKKLASTNDSWEKRYRALEEVSRVDSENLEEQLQSLAGETRTLQADKKLLAESLKKNESSIQKFRAETIELNRQHAETQERLQRIIQQKDRELLELGNRLNQSRTTSSRQQGRTPDSGELTYADTVAINSIDMFDATVQIPAEDMLGKRDKPTSSWKPGRGRLAEFEHESDATQSLDMEESTVALDEEALAFARRSSKSGH